MFLKKLLKFYLYIMLDQYMIMRGWKVVDLMDAESRNAFTELVENYEILHVFPLQIKVPEQASGKFGPYQKNVVKDCLMVIFASIDAYGADSVVKEVTLKGGQDIQPKKKGG